MQIHIVSLDQLGSRELIKVAEQLVENDLEKALYNQLVKFVDGNPTVAELSDELEQALAALHTTDSMLQVYRNHTTHLHQEIAKLLAENQSLRTRIAKVRHLVTVELDTQL